MSEKINYQSFKEVTDFYNKTESAFVEAERKLGINLWFLENFRVYFAYRNMQLNSNSTSGSSGVKIGALQEIKALLSNLSFKPVKGEVAIFAYPSSVRRYFGDYVDDFDLIGLRRVFQENVNLTATNIHQNSDAIFVRYMMSMAFVKDVIVFKKYFKRLVANLQSLSKSENEKLIFTIFCKAESTLLLHFLYFKAYCKFLKKAPLKAVFLINENSPSLKVVQYAAKKFGVKSFAVQHGTIHELHPSYMYGGYNTKPILPDVTFVWGEKDKRLLLDKGGYNITNVEVVGRIDGEKTPDKQHPDLDFSKKIIVFATQPQRDEELRRKVFYDVALVFEEFKGEFQLVVRPHPNEKDDAVFTEVFKGSYLIDRETPLKKHFELCEGLITSFSTVGVEFVPYYKKMLILDYYQQDVMKYIERGVGVQLLNAEMLRNNLRNWDSIRLDENAQKEYIKDTLFQPENPSQYELIDSIIEKHLK